MRPLDEKDMLRRAGALRYGHVPLTAVDARLFLER